jgi:hypothetical protein
MQEQSLMKIMVVGGAILRIRRGVVVIISAGHVVVIGVGRASSGALLFSTGQGVASMRRSSIALQSGVLGLLLGGGGACQGVSPGLLARGCAQARSGVRISRSGGGLCLWLGIRLQGRGRGVRSRDGGGGGARSKRGSPSHGDRCTAGYAGAKGAAKRRGALGGGRCSWRGALGQRKVNQGDDPDS